QRLLRQRQLHGLGTVTRELQPQLAGFGLRHLGNAVATLGATLTAGAAARGLLEGVRYAARRGGPGTGGGGDEGIGLGGGGRGQGQGEKGEAHRGAHGEWKRQR